MSFEIGAGVVGVIGLTIQIIQVTVQFGLDWKDAPADTRSFIGELQALKTVLSETNVNILLNKDFKDAFHGRHSALLLQLQPGADGTDTMTMVLACKAELELLYTDLLKLTRGHRIGWQRLKAAFQSPRTREAVTNLHRKCQSLNQLLAIDSLTLLVGVHHEVKEVRKQQQNMQDHIDIEGATREKQTILNWLTPIDYASQHNDFISRRQEGTGQWLLESSEFGEWLDGEKQTMFCPGIPGAGKTILSSIVIDDLRTRFQDDKGIGIIYVYCNFRQQHEQKAEDLVANLLKQLAQRQDFLPDDVKSLYDCHKNEGTRPSIDELSKTLQSVSARCSKVFIVVDALDECQASDGRLSKFLSEIFSLQTKSRVKFFATSRIIPGIMDKFEGSIRREIRATEQDVRRYVDGNLRRLPSFVQRDLDLQEKVRSGIVSAVNGMFLLAQLHLDSLAGKTTRKAVRAALAELPTGSEAYHAAYNDAMKRIEGQVKDHANLAKQVLSWITCAERPLMTTELQHALAVEVGESELDEENLPDTEDMISVCAGLVTVDEKSGIIRLVHYTTQEYFQRTRAQWFPTAEQDITITCITYLSFKEFESGPSPTDDDFEERMRANQLYNYAARNWTRHVRKALHTCQETGTSDYKDVEKVEKAVMSFSERKGNFEAGIQALFARKGWLFHSKYSQRFPKTMTLFHIAASFGLEAIVKLLLANDRVDPDGKDQYGWTPLIYAAAQGHEGVVKLLLANNRVDPDGKDHEGWTPLIHAAKQGHEGVVKLLLANNKVDPDGKDYSSWTPLIYAAHYGHEGVVKHLLANDRVNPDGKGYKSRTPLIYATQYGCEGIVKLLLANNRVDPNRKDEDGSTPLIYAAQHGHEGLIKLLLANDRVDPNGKGYKGRTPLIYATQYGCEGIVKLLLANNRVDPNRKDEDGLTPLIYAAQHGHEGLVKLLLANDRVDPDGKDYLGWIPLIYATR